MKKSKEKKDDLCQQISKDGFWRTQETANAKLQGPSESKWKLALKAQIKFRQVVLKQQREDKTIFTFSQNKRQFSSRQTHNLNCIGEETLLSIVWSHVVMSCKRTIE